MKKLFFWFFIFSVLFFSCSNAVSLDGGSDTNSGEQTSSERAYIVFNFGNQLQQNSSQNQRSITSSFTAANFSNVVFDGSDGNGHTVHETAASFSELTGRRIYVDTGNWSFTLSADYGSEKYKATTSKTVTSGPNPIQMKLRADTTVAGGGSYDPSEHPGSYTINVEFPADDVDQVTFKILSTSNVTLHEETRKKGIHYTGSGPKTLIFSSDSFDPGVYYIYVSFQNQNRQNASDDDNYEQLNPWGDVLTINPGVRSTGTITLPKTEKVYSINYVMNGGTWATDYDGAIYLSYTQLGGEWGAGGIRHDYITLPPAAAIQKDGCVFDGWYSDEGLSAGPITSFDISPASNKTFYAKWHEAVFDVYISCDGYDDDYVDDATPYGDGTRDHPFKTFTRCYSQTPKVFEDITAQRVDGSPACTVHVLSDYTGTDAFTWGQGTEIEDAKIRIIGAKGGTDGNAVTLTANLPGATDPQCFIYLQQNQQFEVSYVNLTTDKHLSDTQDYCGYGAYNCSTGTTLKLTNCSIKGYYAQGTMLNVGGTVWLDNVEIKDNYAVSDPTKYDLDPPDYWGCGICVAAGTLHIKNKVVVKNNTTLKNDRTDLYCPWNIWIGTGTSFNPIIIDGAITGSDIGVKLDKDIRTFTNNYASKIGATDPTTYFSSDAGFDIEKDDDGDAAVICNVYVNATGSSDTDPSYNGSRTKPFASLLKAVQKITAINNNVLDAKIYVTGTVPSNTVLLNTDPDPDDPPNMAKLVAGNLTIEGTGTGSNWKTAAAETILTGDMNGNGTGDDTILTISATVPITLKNLTLKNGKTTSSGGAICCDGHETVSINSCIIDTNEANNNGGAIYISGSDLVITKTEIKENKVSGVTGGNGIGCGGAVYIASGEMTIDDTVTLESNFSSNYGGAVYVASGGKLSMNNGIIRNNGAYCQGGGVYVAASGEFEMDGTESNAKIINNVILKSTNDNAPSTGRHGGGVYVAQNGKYTMNNGTISNNVAVSGAAVFLRGEFDFKDGLITSNIRQQGSLSGPSAISSNNITYLKNRVSSLLGSATDLTKITSSIEVGIPGTLNMEGGTITSTFTNTWNGSGVCLYASDTSSYSDPAGIATFNMYGGYITGITGEREGAVYMLANGTTAGYNLKFNMYGGNIIGNTGSGTGGVYVGKCGEFHMSGGEISNNHATSGTGGVFITSSGDVDNISLGKAGETSTVVIKDNTYGDLNTISNLKLNSYNVIAVNGPLSTSSEVGITKGFSTADFTENFATNNPGVSPSEIFTSDNGYVITPDTDVEGKFAYGTVNVTPGFPGNYVCKWSQTVSGSTRTINITVKDSSTGTPLEVGTTAGTINSVSVDLYEGADKITSSNSLSFEYPSYLDPPSGTPFYVKFKVKVDETTQYSYDYWPEGGVTYVGEGLILVPQSTFDGTTAVPDSSVFISGRNIGTIKSLIVSDHEVTQGEYTTYCKFGGTQPSEEKGAGDNYPAYYVNWYDAIIYCNLKTINDPALGLEHCVYSLGGDKDPRNWDYDGRDTSDGKYCGPSSENDDWNDGITFDQNADGWRLPTEAEWEYLARGGNLTGTQTTYSGSDTVGNVAWYSQNSGDDGTSTNKKSHEVKGKTANSLGLYDMSGNVCEWCWDRYSGSINSSTPAIGVNASTFSRVKRGGCFSLGASYAEVSYRSGDLAHSRNNINYYGFRVVRSSD